MINTCVEKRIDIAKLILKKYLNGFCYKNNIVYGLRLNTEKGLSVLESVENVRKGIAAGIYKPWGYGSGIEDCAYQTGTLLYALCEAYEATGEEYFQRDGHNRDYFKSLGICPPRSSSRR